MESTTTEVASARQFFLPQFSVAYDESEDFDCYVERFELFLVANGLRVPEDDDTTAHADNNRRVIAVFLNAIGPRYYGMLRDLVAPAKPKDKKYSELMRVLRKHFKRTPVTVAERRKFLRCDQEGESINEYIVRLKHLSLNCDYGAKLDENLRDRFISGLRNETTSLKLMEKASENPDLTFLQAADLALARENAVGEMREMRTKEKSNATVHAVRGKEGRRKVQECFRCGRHHNPDDCWYKRTVCRHCQKQGHLERKCLAKNKNKDRKKEQTNSNKNKLSSSRSKGQRAKHERVQKVHEGQGSRQRSSSTCSDSSDDDSKDTMHKVGYDNTVFKLRVQVAHKKGASGSESNPIIVPVAMEGHISDMELDTGSSVSIVPLSYYDKYLSHLKLYPSSKNLVGFVKDQTVQPVGKVKVNVKYDKYEGKLDLYVVEHTEYLLFGRDWLRIVPLNWNSLVKHFTACKVHEVNDKCEEYDHQVNDDLSKVLHQHESLFDDRLGKLSNVKAHITVKKEANPVTTRPYKVPFAMKAKVEDELDRLEKCGVLTPIEYSEWSTGIVAIPKKDGSVRICGNYKTTVNPVLEPVQPPNINVDHILANLGGGVLFSTLDLAHAYNQLELDEESKKYLVISTHKGLYRQNRLVFGITSAPAIWQKAIEQVLQGLPGVQVYLDDILVTGRTPKEHNENLNRVLNRLEQRNLTLRKEKCKFAQESVQFLGHMIDAKGVHTVEEKVQKIENIPRPEDVSQLRSYLGLLNYYRKYVPNLAHEIAPLTDLLKSDRKFKWSDEAEIAFKRSKQLMRDAGFLVHYDPEMPISIATDASPIGIGAVLSHMLPNGEERPIQFASRSLTKTEKKYPQIEREALAIVFALRKFYMYVYGHRFTLITDNKPLTALLGPYKSLPALAAERMQRWAMYLAGFDYVIKYRTSKENANADCLSRLPDKQAKPEGCEPEVVSVCHIDTLPITHRDLRKATRNDPILSKVLRYTLDGWPTHLSTEESDLKPFFRRRLEITVEQGILMWGMRIIVPYKGRNAIIDELHSGHIGVVKMKSLARSYVWWPQIDVQIEECTKRCSSCQVVQNQPSQTLLHPWIPASKPMERIHIDFAGPFEGLTYMVIVDAYSKWPEAYIMRSITSERTIEILRSVFARYGLPQIMVTDNGTQFTSTEFQEFVNQNGIVHKRSAPYHPSTNGQAERFVQSLKQGMRAARSDGGSAQAKLDRFLLAYRNSSHAITGESPATLFMKRPLRIRLDNLRPNIDRRYAEQLHDQSVKRKAPDRLRKFEVGDTILARDYVGKLKWMPGVVVDREGPLMYKVQVQKGIWRRHVDQLLPRLEHDTEVEQSQSRSDFEVTQNGSDILDSHRSNLRDAHFVPSQDEVSDSSQDRQTEMPQNGLSVHQDNANSSEDILTQTQESSQVLRRSQRKRKPPDRLNL